MVNDYDLYAAQRQQDLISGQSLGHRFVEKPAMKKLLPDLNGKSVLMLGCGTGEESLLLEERGAKNMYGIDSSSESVKLAAKIYPGHKFSVGDMHHLDFADNSFDFIYSSLVVHYSANPADVCREIYRVLKPGGSFQFSIVHPVRWASERLELGGVKTKLLGYSEGKSLPRLYGSYSDFKEYSETFPSGEILQFWVGPPSMHFSLLRNAGFNVIDFVETKAIDACKEVNEAYYQRFSRFPQFTIFVSEKTRS